MSKLADSPPVSIIGAGAFGSALALAIGRAGREVLLYGRDKVRLPDWPEATGISVHSDLHRAASTSLIVMAMPTQNLREASATLAPLLAGNSSILSAAKGIEQKTGLFVTQILRETFGETHHFGVISGPSFASDIARGLPTAISLAMDDLDEAGRIAAFLGSNSLRLYHTDDVRGVEIGGAAKNVLAIAAGIVVGMQLGESARAAMIARGFAELRRFADAFGGRPETLMGLSGLGDLILTASSAQSRNFSLGLGLGQGRSVAEATSGKLAEGAFTAAILTGMAGAKGVEMPIASAVSSVLEGRISVKQAVADLMARPMRGE